jgi:hypothetical protein
MLGWIGLEIWPRILLKRYESPHGARFLQNNLFNYPSRVLLLHFFSENLSKLQNIIATNKYYFLLEKKLNLKIQQFREMLDFRRAFTSTMADKILINS